MIPEIVVALALTAGIVFVFRVRAMPILLRISLIIPQLWLAIIYYWPMEISERLPLVRIGLIIFGISEVVVSLMTSKQTGRKPCQRK